MRLARLARNLLRVVSEDLAADDEGGMQVIERTTSARLISYTDPEAQHFRKSKSKVCSGFKLHALGDAVSGLVLSLSVTPGGHHDSTQLHPLVARARALCADFRELLADAAYGGVGVRVETRDRYGVTVLAPPVGNSRKGDGLGKEDFAIDFDAMCATCPGGVTTSQWKLAPEGTVTTPMFTWSKESAAVCTCASTCPVHRDRRRHLKLHPLEQELRAIRVDWAKPETRKRYRRRTEGERLMRVLGDSTMPVSRRTARAASTTCGSSGACSPRRGPPKPRSRTTPAPAPGIHPPDRRGAFGRPWSGVHDPASCLTSSMSTAEARPQGAVSAHPRRRGPRKLAMRGTRSPPLAPSRLNQPSSPEVC